MVVWVKGALIRVRVPDIESKRETLIRHRSACTYEGNCMQRLCRTRILNTLCVPTCLMALFRPEKIQTSLAAVLITAPNLPLVGHRGASPLQKTPMSLVLVLHLVGQSDANMGCCLSIALGPRPNCKRLTRAFSGLRLGLRYESRQSPLTSH